MEVVKAVVDVEAGEDGAGIRGRHPLSCVSSKIWSLVKIITFVVKEKPSVKTKERELFSENKVKIRKKKVVNDRLLEYRT